ncbi:unnamed protein product [Litomosoides sigmodontis]|uniref:Protein kinase domain-containing protein n=1 Tax=Litomosoides sigmodontis TaxID=42156 RepID=A0A3P6SV96_LITSI|nr:unnamed protein product [Litomosoides sigmodontis]
MTESIVNTQTHDEVPLTDDNVKSDFPVTTRDLHVTDAAHDFCERLKARSLFFRKSQAEGIEDRNVYPVYSKSGRRYIVKVSPGGGLEASLLLQSSTNFFILEFCEYGSLEKLLGESGVVPTHRQHIAKILCGVAKAIYFLHS